MRMMITLNMDAADGSRAIHDGTLGKVMEAFMRDYKPEAAYYTAMDGERTAWFVVDMPDSSHMPSIAEPFFNRLNARVSFRPVMNAEELRIGLKRFSEPGEE